jgi:hypothetical protein
VLLYDKGSTKKMESEKVNYADKNEQLWSAALAGEEERVLSLIAEGANLSGYKKVNTDNYSLDSI